MNKIEELILDKIIQSAKKKMNFKEWETELNEIDENLFDDFIFDIIVGLAANESSQFIAGKLFAKIALTGFYFDEKELEKNIEVNKDFISQEVWLMQMSSSLLADGTDPLVVLDFVCKFV